MTVIIKYVSLQPDSKEKVKGKDTIDMANHKSSIKRIRQTEKRRLHNRYFAKNMRNEVKKFRSLTDKSEAESQLPKIYSIIDKVAKHGIIHKNKAANLKSKLTKYTAKLA